MKLAKSKRAPREDPKTLLKRLAAAPPSESEIQLRIATLLKKRKDGKTLTRREQAELAAFASDDSRALKPEPEFVQTFEELGQIFGPHRVSFSRFRTEHPDAPEPRADGRHSVPAWRKFFTDHPDLLRRSHADAAMAGDRVGLETERLRQQVRELTRINDEAERRLVPKTELTPALVELAAKQQSLLRQKIENEHPALVPGLDPAQRAELRRLGKQLVDTLCAETQRLVAAWKI